MFLDDGEEQRGVVCQRCGGSVTLRGGRAHCDQDGAVTAIDDALPAYRYTSADLKWFADNQAALAADYM